MQGKKDCHSNIICNLQAGKKNHTPGNKHLEYWTLALFGKKKKTDLYTNILYSVYTLFFEQPQFCDRKYTEIFEPRIKTIFLMIWWVEAELMD